MEILAKPVTTRIFHTCINSTVDSLKCEFKGIYFYFYGFNETFTKITLFGKVSSKMTTDLKKIIVTRKNIACLAS